MEYTAGRLAGMAGISARTLRYYDEIGLLKPSRISSSGYRIYGRPEVDTLQEILFLRELGLDLESIGAILSEPKFDRLSALQSHLGALEAEKKRLDSLISNVRKTIKHHEEEHAMNDNEKFEGFKKQLIRENEDNYGAEVRERYGADAADASNAKLMGLTKLEYDRMQELAEEIKLGLEAAVKENAPPSGEAGREICEKHRVWLCFTWPSYSADAHRGLGQMIIGDERFTAYYDDKVPGCAAFIRDAIEAWAK